MPKRDETPIAAEVETSIQPHRGARNDLRRGRDVPEREAIEGIALAMAEIPMEGGASGPKGVTAHDLALATKVSKEWGRIILRGLEEEGRLISKSYGQVKIYYIKN